MKFKLITFILICFTAHIFGQNTKLVVEENAPNGNLRTLLVLDNQASGSHASTVFTMRSGSGADQVTGSISLSNESYTAIPNINGYLNITSGNSSGTIGGNGINFRAANSLGNFRFYTGGFFPSDLKMTLSNVGNLGLGTETPNSKLQLADGDIYIEDFNSGVIMTSSDGACWRLTVETDGSLKTTSVTCP